MYKAILLQLQSHPILKLQAPQLEPPSPRCFCMACISSYNCWICSSAPVQHVSVMISCD